MILALMFVIVVLFCALWYIWILMEDIEELNNQVINLRMQRIEQSDESLNLNITDVDSGVYTEQQPLADDIDKNTIETTNNETSQNNDTQSVIEGHEFEGHVQQDKVAEQAGGDTGTDLENVSQQDQDEQEEILIQDDPLTEPRE